MTSPRERLIAEWRNESREVQADYDARHPKVAYANGLSHCADQLAALPVSEEGQEKEADEDGFSQAAYDLWSELRAAIGDVPQRAVASRYLLMAFTQGMLRMNDLSRPPSS